MRRIVPRIAFTVLALPLGACSGDPAGLRDINPSLERTFPGLEAEVSVLRTEMNVAHIYAENALDLARVQGFVTAQDRYVQIELARRFGAGTLSELLGDLGLSIDTMSRGRGLRFVAERAWENMTPEQQARFDAYADGVNAYIEDVKKRKSPLPEEIEIVAGLSGFDPPSEAMEPITGFDLAAIGAVMATELGFETTDLSSALIEDQLLDHVFEGANANLRRDGALNDIWNAVAPVNALAQVRPGVLENTSSLGAARSEAGRLPSAGGLFERLRKRNRWFTTLLGKPEGTDFGSNSWAVAKAGTNGRGTLLANDGHLPLTVPTFFYQMCLDTKYFGDDDHKVCGLFFPGMPMLAVGTNGQLAWGQTYLYGDLTDWYREELRLDANGRPTDSKFAGDWKPLVPTEETYRLPKSDDPKTYEEVSFVRYNTFDGRWIISVEGSTTTLAAAQRAGQPVLALDGEWVVPSDRDNDGVISAVSFDWTGFDISKMLSGVEGFSRAKTVAEFAEHTKKLVAYGQNLIVADESGAIMYSGYTPLPCRSELEKDANGSWVAGANPQRLLDGTRYGGFEIPVNDRGLPIESGSDCIIPFEAGPRAISPSVGYVHTANHDPTGDSFDDRMGNEAYYFGGNYALGFRARTIDEELGRQVAAHSATVESMAALQANHASGTGRMLTPVILEAVALVKDAEGRSSRTAAEDRMVAVYQGAKSRVDAAVARLGEWQDRGAVAESGVDTFYRTHTAEERRDAVATMIFHGWLRQLSTLVLADEGIDFVFEGGRAIMTIRTLHRIFAGRGPNNPMGLSSWDAATGESVFFDNVATSEVETSHEMVLRALVEAMDFLAAPPTGQALGGFGTADMDQWLWGLRHQVAFTSLVGEIETSNPLVGILSVRFGLTTEQLPLAENLSANDPRKDLINFPRPGDFFTVDAATPSLKSRGYFHHSNGPVMRMVIELLGDGEVRGQNILPGGQSGDLESPHFADQAAKWLGNQTVPMRFSAESAVEGATAREVYAPSK